MESSHWSTEEARAWGGCAGQGRKNRNLHHKWNPRSLNDPRSGEGIVREFGMVRYALI